MSARPKLTERELDHANEDKVAEARAAWSEVLPEVESSRPSEASWHWSHMVVYAIGIGCIAAAILDATGVFK